MDSLKVQVLSRKLVKPSKPTPEHLRQFKLSIFDQLAPPAYVNVVLYYPYNIESNNISATVSERCIRLEKSLSEALTQYYPLAGRLMHVGLYIDCSDKGVDYLEARVTGDLSEFLSNGLKIEVLNKFVPWDIDATGQVSNPLTVIQINMFDDGGLAVGIQMSHTIADASTLVSFVNKWANISRSCNDSGVISTISNDLASVFPATYCPGREYLTTPLENSSKIITKRFVFRGPAISALKAKVTAESHYAYQPTRVSVVMAAIWKAVIQGLQSKNRHSEDVSVLAPSMNCRGKLVSAPPTGSYSIGNLWIPFTVRFQTKKVVELHHLVGVLKDKISDTNMIISTSTADEISSMATNSFAEVLEELEKNNALFCTSWCGFPFYEADFGWGKPFWVSTLAVAWPMITLLDDRYGDGIEALVSLDENDMINFEKDSDIQQQLNLCNSSEAATV